VGSFCQENTTKGDGGRGEDLFFLLKTTRIYIRTSISRTTSLDTTSVLSKDNYTLASIKGVEIKLKYVFFFARLAAKHQTL